MTNKEIAQLLNISPATVSLALNNKPGVGEETRQKILEMKGASLRNNIESISRQVQGGDIGLVIYKEGMGVIDESPFFHELFDSLDQWTTQNAYRFQLFQISAANVQDYIDSINASSLVGVLILATEMTNESAALFGDMLKKPFVLLDAYFPSIRVDSVLMDNFGGISGAVEYAVSCGHTDIGFLNSEIPCRNFIDRYDRFVTERFHRPEIRMETVIDLPPTIEGATERMREYLQGDPDLPSVFIAGNDRIAIGAMRALLEKGHRMPEEVSIIGFDDMPMAQYLTPALTSVRLRENEIAKLAVERLVYKILHPKECEYTVQHLMEVEIVPRDSVWKF
jgi:LacI family transcriptional regulator